RHGRRPFAGADDVEEAERRLAAHEGGIGEVRRRWGEARGVRPAPGRVVAVTGRTVVGEQRASAVGRRRGGRVDLFGDTGLLHDGGANDVQVGTHLIERRFRLDAGAG